MADSHVTKEVLELNVKILDGKLNQLLDLHAQLLEQQKLTNGKVQKHETDLTRIKAIGGTVWGGLTLLVGWLGWR